VAKVKRLCLLIQRMDKQGADADMPEPINAAC
jgi:hypothetical protein